MEEARTKEEAMEDKHSRERSPMQTKHNRRNNKEDGINMDAPTITANRIGDTEDITVRDHMIMERGISRKMSPRKNGK